MIFITFFNNYLTLHASHLVRTRTKIETSSTPIEFCFILGNIITCIGVLRGGQGGLAPPPKIG